MFTLHDVISAARHTLVDAGFRSEDAALDAEVLARHVLGWDLAQLISHGSDPAPAWFGGKFDALVSRRVRREPVALITGHREFWGLDFRVTPDTLIPRPETELIVEEALRRVSGDSHATIIDIGTGTGCLAVALATERPRARIIATDLSHAALLVARENAHHHAVDGRIRFVQTDLASGISVGADLIVSNPPYVPDIAAATLPADVRSYEPPAALFGGPDGLAVIRRLLGALADRLTPGGCVILEFGFGQEDDVTRAAGENGWRVERILADLQGIPRTIVLGR
jgi:release factor glutamine methyltransferase